MVRKFTANKVLSGNKKIIIKLVNENKLNIVIITLTNVDY